MEPLRHELLLRKEEGRQVATGTGLSPDQQMDDEEPQRIPPNPASH